MRIQNTDVEYGLFYMLIGKLQSDVYLRLMTNGVTPAYFSISFMRKLLKIAFAYLAKGRVITYDTIANYYRSSGGYTEDDEIMIESLKADVNKTGAIGVSPPPSCQCYSLPATPRPCRRRPADAATCIHLLSSLA